jgi:DNA repair photolyase
MRLFKEKRKSPILKPPVFGCLKDIPSINITRGCIHSCVYCYARGFTDAPPKGEVHLYVNLPEKLVRELDRKKRLPEWVTFSTASDPFQQTCSKRGEPIDDILTITYRTMKILLERGIGISLLTKGFIPDEIIGLFRKYPDRIKARIGIVSMNDDYKRLFETFAASPMKRLLNIRNLINAGIETTVRIDPIIPNITDSEGELEHLIKRLKVHGVKSLSVSHLIIRPSIINQFVKELPFKTAKELIHLYHGQPWQRVITSARTRVLPKEMRINTYRIIKDIAKRYSIECHTCGCKNPDLPWEFCSPWIDFRDTIPLSSVERRAGHPSNGWVGEDTQLDLFKDATVCKN